MEIGHDYCSTTTLKALHSEESTSAGTFCATTPSLPVCPKLGTGWPIAFYSTHAMASGILSRVMGRLGWGWRLCKVWQCSRGGWGKVFSGLPILSNTLTLVQLSVWVNSFISFFLLREHMFISKALGGESEYNRLSHGKWNTCISLKVTACKCIGCFHIQGF